MIRAIVPTLNRYVTWRAQRAVDAYPRNYTRRLAKNATKAAKGLKYRLQVPMNPREVRMKKLKIESIGAAHTRVERLMMYMRDHLEVPIKDPDFIGPQLLAPYKADTVAGRKAQRTMRSIKRKKTKASSMLMDQYNKPHLVTREEDGITWREKSTLATWADEIRMQQEKVDEYKAGIFDKIMKQEQMRRVKKDMLVRVKNEAKVGIGSIATVGVAVPVIKRRIDEVHRQRKGV